MEDGGRRGTSRLGRGARCRVLRARKRPRIPTPGVQLDLRQGGSAAARDPGPPKPAAHNITFTCLWILRDVDGCADLLSKTGRLAEAALFLPDVQAVADARRGERVEADAGEDQKGPGGQDAGVPGEDEDLFPEWEEWLRLEREGVSVEDVENGEKG